jgi:DNA-directed RNA polymerase subunit beta'
MNITKASPATEPWLSAASFQETTRVSAEATVQCRSDPRVRLKENVIIGKHIPRLLAPEVGAE